MKKALLLFAMALCVKASYGQHNIFMNIVENKLLCTEDRLVYFLEDNSFIRKSQTFSHQYANNGAIFNTAISYDNGCYALYSTDNAKEYERIVKEITAVAEKKYSPDKKEYYACTTKRIHNVHFVFLGFVPQSNAYEIKIYQNPGWDEMVY
jgi:hypothetical protein